MRDATAAATLVSMTDADVTGLIEHGRDREAAALGAAPTKGDDMDVLRQLGLI